jgi:predicted TIM-barrel fold metal-dependent hydrolase
MPMIPACLPPRDVSRPNVPPPPNGCDTHAHVFGPSKRFPYADDRSYTPPDAPLEKYLGMLDQIGFDRGVLVQGSAHGHDNSAMLDALKRCPDRLRGVAVADADIPLAELRAWNRLGVRGLRLNHFFRDGQLHYLGGVPLTAAERLAPAMAELGWHLQLWIDVRANPERLVWGGDWPHPRIEGEMPDAGHLFELFQMWTPDRSTQHRILVTNPARLYGFPN